MNKQEVRGLIQGAALPAEGYEGVQAYTRPGPAWRNHPELPLGRPALLTASTPTASQHWWYWEMAPKPVWGLGQLPPRAVQRQHSPSNRPMAPVALPQGHRDTPPPLSRQAPPPLWPCCQNTVIFCHMEEERVGMESPAAMRPANCLKTLIALSSPTWSLCPTPPPSNHGSGSHIEAQRWHLTPSAPGSPSLKEQPALDAPSCSGAHVSEATW